jgi:hypothetical protein
VVGLLQLLPLSGQVRAPHHANHFIWEGRVVSGQAPLDDDSCTVPTYNTEGSLILSKTWRRFFTVLKYRFLAQ